MSKIRTLVLAALGVAGAAAAVALLPSLTAVAQMGASGDGQDWVAFGGNQQAQNIPPPPRSRPTM